MFVIAVTKGPSQVRALSCGVQRRDWARRDGIFEPFVPFARKVFQERDIRRLQTDDEADASTFWTLLNYALWRRLWIDEESLESLNDELDVQLGR